MAMLTVAHRFSGTHSSLTTPRSSASQECVLRKSRCPKMSILRHPSGRPALRVASGPQARLTAGRDLEDLLDRELFHFALPARVASSPPTPSGRDRRRRTGRRCRSCPVPLSLLLYRLFP